jgi:hypothetical protein
VFLHTRLGHTLNDIYAEQLKLKRNQLKKRSRRYGETFSFRNHCLFYGKESISVLDPKNPNRWCRVVQCRTADSGSSHK